MNSPDTLKETRGFLYFDKPMSKYFYFVCREGLPTQEVAPNRTIRILYKQFDTDYFLRRPLTYKETSLPELALLL